MTEKEYTLTFTESEVDAITCALQTGMAVMEIFWNALMMCF